MSDLSGSLFFHAFGYSHIENVKSCPLPPIYASYTVSYANRNADFDRGLQTFDRADKWIRRTESTVLTGFCHGFNRPGFNLPTMKSLDADKKTGKADAANVSEAADAQANASDIQSYAAGDNNGFFTANDKIDFSNVKIEPLFEEAVDFDTFSKSDFRAVKVKECIAVPKSKKLLQFTLDDGTGTDRTILSGIHAFYEPEELVGKTLIAITNLPPRKMMGVESCGMLLSAVNNLKDSEDEELHLLMVDNHIPAGAKLY